MKRNPIRSIPPNAARIRNQGGGGSGFLFEVSLKMEASSVGSKDIRVDNGERFT